MTNLLAGAALRRGDEELPKYTPDFVKLAEAMGAVGIRVTTKEELPKAIAKAIELNTTVVLDCIIDSDDKVFPMVPAGANIEDAFDIKFENTEKILEILRKIGIYHYA